MSKDTRILFYALLAGFLVVFLTQIVTYRVAVETITEEVRVGDGHVSSTIHQHNDGALER